MGSFDLLPPPEILGETEKPMPTPAKRYDVRVLDAAEAGMLDHVFRAQGVEPPDQRFAFIVGAVEEESGRVSENFLVVQLRVHAEPLNLEPGCDVLFTRLAQAAEETIAQRVGTCDVFLFAPAGKVAKMAQVVGMRTEPWVVCSKRIEGSGPVVETHEEQPVKRTRVRRKKEQVQ